MSLSSNSRLTNIDEAVRLFMADLQGLSILESFFEEGRENGVLPTTWTELKNRGLIRATNVPYLYTLSGDGWILGLKLLGEYETDSLKRDAGKLMAALKDELEGRELDAMLSVDEAALKSGLTPSFIRNAIESDLIGNLFDRQGASWETPADRGKFINIPSDFGLSIL